MNYIFAFICSLSILMLLFTSPQKIVEIMLEGGTKAVNLTIALASIYSLWMGVFAMAEKSGMTKKLSLLLKKTVEKLFGKCSEQTVNALTINLSANLLGISGVATPKGIEACSLLEKEKNIRGMGLLVVIASTSLQIFPTSVIALAIKHGSKNPSFFILPSLLTTFVSSFTGITLYMIFTRKKKK